MSTVVIALALGVCIGYWQVIPVRFSRWAGYLTWCGLFILLLSMGVKVGSNEKILSSLGSLGLQAFILALFAVIFSVLILFILEKSFIQKGKKRNVGEEI